MATRFRHAAIVGKYNAEGIREELKSVAAFLVANGLAVTLEEDTAVKTGIDGYPRLAAAALGTACDIAVVVGGDGTMLGIARQLARHDTPLVGINQGRLGFITDIALGDFQAALAPILAGEFEEEARAMLEGEVERDGKTIFASIALNDVIVGRGATAGMVELRIEIDGQFVAQLRADGLIVGSPTGSTAYALSAGGPILHPRIAGWVLVPIAPHDLSNRPIVVPDDGEVQVEIVSGRDATVNFDMQSLTSLGHGDLIRVRRSADRVRFLHPRGWSYYATLRGKLHWASGVEVKAATPSPRSG
ncbi:MAG: NAD kinase [Pseudomonadota bacterium]|nr:NAD kinase [Pseudomonadota bacterium]